MESQLEQYRLTLTEYKGRVFGWHLDDPESWLRSQSADPRDPDFWQRQAHWHHAHPCDSVDDCRAFELRLIGFWCDQLMAQMPQRSFVIEIDHGAQVTWYELMPGAPSEDGEWTFSEYRREDLTDEEFRAIVLDGFDAIQAARVAKFARHNPRACPLCKVEAGFSEPRLDDEHRGIQWKTCLNCGEQILHATRVIREAVWSTR